MLTVTCERNLPLKVEEENQGIISILSSNSRGPKPPPAGASFRRTLSADMSSKKWLAENGFNKPHAMKRISSSVQLSVISAVDNQSSSSEDEEELDGKKFEQNPQQDLWSSIVSQKKAEDLPPPYVHHLVKKSSSSLCSKSLEICTESLGSETGSDKVILDTGSNKISLDTGSNRTAVDTSSDKVEELSQQAQQEKETPEISYAEETPKVSKYNSPAASNKKLQPKSFPPPIPLLAGSTEGPAVHMQSHRLNGRLVLKAVSSPSTKKLQAHRQDGHLRLTLIQPPNSQQHVQQLDRDKAVLFDEKEYTIKDNLGNVSRIQDANDILGHDYGIIKDVEEGIDEIQDTVTKQELPEMAREVVNIHRSALMIKKIMGMENQNPKWSHKLNHRAALIETENEEGKETSLHSLPPRPRTTRPIPATPPAASLFNAYEYFWRIKPVVSGIKNPITQCPTLRNNTNNNTLAPDKPKSLGQQELLALRTCRKARRSLLSWDAYCIATT